MTKEEWEKAEYLGDMLRHLFWTRERRLTPLIGQRKARLFACACLLIWGIPPDHEGFLAAEEFSEGWLSYQAFRACTRIPLAGPWSSTMYGLTIHSEDDLLQISRAFGQADPHLWIAAADALRDIQPYDPPSVDRNWLTPTVLAGASAIYKDRLFHEMPILADALEDAGCQDAGILNHCRSERIHYKGCWVLDAITGRA